MRPFHLATLLLSICCGIVFAANSIQLDSEESNFLEAHNLVRSRYNAQPLDWSATLASKAQTWASGCLFEHTNGHLGPYGENIAAGTGNFTARNAMDMFMAGQQTFDATNSAFSDFTQIIWQSTTDVGCASAQCCGIFDESFGDATVYVCLYEPVGNVVGELLSVTNRNHYAVLNSRSLQK
ncbi:CAP domain-containing protein [Chiua virens]|nr:CAP domain-containing protein [Chiua virens]